MAAKKKVRGLDELTQYDIYTIKRAIRFCLHDHCKQMAEEFKLSEADFMSLLKEVVSEYGLKKPHLYRSEVPSSHRDGPIGIPQKPNILANRKFQGLDDTR